METYFSALDSDVIASMELSFFAKMVFLADFIRVSSHIRRIIQKNLSFFLFNCPKIRRLISLSRVLLSTIRNLGKLDSTQTCLFRFSVATLIVRPEA
jgi:hypothetical protein